MIAGRESNLFHALIALIVFRKEAGMRMGEVGPPFRGGFKADFSAAACL